MKNKLIKIHIIASLILFLLISAGRSVSAQPATQNASPGIENTARLNALFERWHTLEAPLAPTAAATVLPDAPAIGSAGSVFLTFDDGPSLEFTPQVVDLLKRYNATAVFFVCGRSVVSHPEIVHMAAQSGQFFGNHSYNHPKLGDAAYEVINGEIMGTFDAINNALASDDALKSQVTPCMRPPYGNIGSALSSYLAVNGLVTSMWTLDTEDWRGYSPSEIYNFVMESVKPNSVILFHDGGEKRENSVLALGLVLHELTQQGYRFDPFCTKSGMNPLLLGQ